jgi:hypothetical protein
VNLIVITNESKFIFIGNFSSDVCPIARLRPHPQCFLFAEQSTEYRCFTASERHSQNEHDSRSSARKKTTQTQRISSSLQLTYGAACHRART